MNRAQQPRVGTPANHHVSAPASAPVPMPSKKHEASKPTGGKLFRITTITLLFSVAVLIASLAAYIGFGNSDQEGKFINKNEYQAVFINNLSGANSGLYFGRIKDLTNNYIHLTNVFYLQSQAATGSGSSSSSSASYQLVKLGCEVHGPEDEMVINRDQVMYWENLKSGGEVSKKIADFYQANPNGQTCSSTSSSSSTPQSSTGTQSSNSSTGGSSSSTSNTTKQ